MQVNKQLTNTIYQSGESFGSCTQKFSPRGWLKVLCEEEPDEAKISLEILNGGYP